MNINLLLNKVVSGHTELAAFSKIFQPIFLLVARIYVGWVFFSSGLTKLDDWESTLFLFEYEYLVPLLNFVFAAYLATIGEIVLPILLVLGLASRFSAIGLSVINVVAVISLEEIAPAAFNEHVIWGVLLFQVVIWGAGLVSLDRLYKTILNKRKNRLATDNSNM